MNIFLLNIILEALSVSFFVSVMWIECFPILKIFNLSLITVPYLNFLLEKLLLLQD